MELRRRNVHGLLTGADGLRYGVSVVTFRAAPGFAPVTHIAVLDVARGLYFPAVLAGGPPGFTVSDEDGETSTVFDLGDGKTRRLVSTATLKGTILLDGKAVAVEGPAWVETEISFCTPRNDWFRMDVQLDDGRRFLFQSTAAGRGGSSLVGWAADGMRGFIEEDRAGCVTSLRGVAPTDAPAYAVEWEFAPSVDERLHVVAARDDQRILDHEFLRLLYWSGFCTVLKDSVPVGYAWVEQVPKHWGFPALELTLLDQAMLGNRDAYELCKTLAWISQRADDFADGEATGAPKMADLLAWALFDLQKNPFYQQHRADLDPVLEMCLLYWEASDEWKLAAARETRMHGFVYRECMEMAIARVALLIGGREHSRRVIRGMHDFYHVRDGELFDVWEESEHGRRR